MPNFGRQAWDAGQLYRAQDVGMRIPFASLLGPPGDQPAQPLPSQMQWREGIPLPTGQVQAKPAQEGRKDDYLRTSLDMLTRSRLPLPSAASVASFLPGGGMVAAGESSRAIPEAVRAGNYGQAGLSALETALNVGGEALPFLKAAAVPLAAARKGQLSDLADLYRSGYSKTKHTIPIDEWRATQEATGELAPKKTIEPADLQGKLLIGEMWDRTLGGHRLTGIGGRPLAEPVELQGGLTFQRGRAAQGPDRAITASDLGQVNRIAGFAEREAARTGLQPVLAPSIMGERAGDFSHMQALATLGQLPGAKISKADLKAFDAALRSTRPEFLGLAGIQKGVAPLREQFLGPKAGGLRKAFAEQAAAGEWTQKGFPDPGQTRWAITDPELRWLPTGSSGLSFADIDPGAKAITNPAVPHATYPMQLSGTYLGGFSHPVDIPTMYPDWAETLRAQGKGQTKETLNRAFQIGNVSQVANQKWVDAMSRALEEARRRGP